MCKTLDTTWLMKTLPLWLLTMALVCAKLVLLEMTLPEPFSPSIVGRPRHQGVMVGMGQKDSYVGRWGPEQERYSHPEIPHWTWNRHQLGRHGKGKILDKALGIRNNTPSLNCSFSLLYFSSTRFGIILSTTNFAWHQKSTQYFSQKLPSTQKPTERKWLR